MTEKTTPHFNTPYFINRPRLNPPSALEKIRQAQRQSVKYRDMPVTLKQAPWVEEVAE